MAALDRLKIDLSRYSSDQQAVKIDELASLGERFDQLAISQENLQREQQVLESLHFSVLGKRRETIPEAHERTFRWAFDANVRTGGDGKDVTSLSWWLRGGNGIFWVSGKPGSGKSTLMKFIASAKETKTLISQWQPHRRCIVASHYFWNAGSTMQKSLKGLLRSILFDIFRQHPALIDPTCGDQLGGSHHAAESQSWSLSRLHKTLKKAVSCATDQQYSICLFIDGLDEYEGDHDHRMELCQLFLKLAQSPHIKICLSSRPWNIFEDVFGPIASKIHLQDLTRNDIEEYVRNRLQGHPRWRQLAVSQSQDTSLVAEVSERASGVFLWVYLVTKLLCEGLTNQDRISDLRRRLNSIPRQLEDFFKQMLDSVDSFYHSKMSEVFQIALTAREPLEFPIFEFHDMEHDDPKYALKTCVKTIASSELDLMRSRVASQLNSRTCGLLEISAAGVVNFLHRTVRDFLSQQNMTTFLEQKASQDRHFDPNWSIVQALSAWIKLQPVSTPIYRRGWCDYTSRDDSPGLISACSLSDYTEMVCEYAYVIEHQGSRSLELEILLDDLESAISQLLKVGIRTVPAQEGQFPTTAMFREQLIGCTVFGYLEAKTKKDPEYLLSLPAHWPLRIIGAAPSIQEENRLSAHKRGTDTLQYLLRTHKLKPNRRDWEGQTPWGELLLWITSSGSKGLIEPMLSDLLEEGNILSLFVQNGADPNIKVSWPLGGYPDDSSSCWSCSTCVLSLAPLVCSSQYSEERHQAFLGFLDELVDRGMDFTVPTVYFVLEDIFGGLRDISICLDPPREAHSENPPSLIAVLMRVMSRARATGASEIVSSVESMAQLVCPQMRGRVMTALGLDRPKAKRCLTDNCGGKGDNVSPKRARM